MIKQIPGWANLLAIIPVYYLLFYVILDLPFGFERAFFDARRYAYAFGYGAFYMAKWRYVNGSWGFNGNLLEWIKKFILGGAL